jgi:hypothetical protein
MSEHHHGHDHGHIDPTLDSCCAKDMKAQLAAANVQKLFDARDPVRRALKARSIVAPVRAHDDTRLCGHAYAAGDAAAAAAAAAAAKSAVSVKDADDDDDSDLDGSDFSDDDEAIAAIREARFAHLKLTPKGAQSGDALPPLACVVEAELMKEVAAGDMCVVFFREQNGGKAAADCNIMDGYLRSLAVETAARGDVRIVECVVTATSSLIMDLMLFILPSLVCFRKGQVVNRCVGAFSHVFPSFDSSPASVRLWVDRSLALSLDRGDEGRGGELIDAATE